MYYFDVNNPRNRTIKQWCKHTDILVIRVNSKGLLVYSKPCVHCIRIMKKFGIKRVYYSIDNGSIQVEHVSKITSTHESATISKQTSKIV